MKLSGPIDVLYAGKDIISELKKQNFLRKNSETPNCYAIRVDQLAGDKTLIIIAHRLNTVRHCDKIDVMGQGEVVDRSTFDDLPVRNSSLQPMIELASVSSGEKA